MAYSLDTIVSWAKRKGFVYPNSEIYGGLANAWDYGPYGSVLKKNIADQWIKYFITERDDMVLMDTAIIANPQTWIASGHAGAFGDALIDDKNTKQRFRADKIIEDFLSKQVDYIVKNPGDTLKTLEEIGDNAVNNINGEMLKQKGVMYEIDEFKRAFGEYQHSNMSPESSQVVMKYVNPFKHWQEKQNEINENYNIYMDQINTVTKILDALVKKDYISAICFRFGIQNFIPESWGNEKMTEFIRNNIPNNPENGKIANWTEARQFNLMLQTQLGVIEDSSSKAYLRPETCQSLFTNFKNLCNTTRMRIPFGMAQIGKAFRNEITPGQFLYRTREFEQMEIEYFVENDLEKSHTYFQMRKELSMKFWQEIIQLNQKNLRFREHEKDELSFYSAGTFDVEYLYPWGRGELQGIANRTNYDLTQHQTVSQQNLQYNDPKTGERYIPYVIEPSFGLSRTVMAVMLDCYDEEVVKEGDIRIVVRFPKHLAPVKFAIFPLMEKDDGMSEMSRKIFVALKKKGYTCEYDGSGNIGKRYRRQDEIGTPYCVTIDHQSLEDGTVTMRERDTMEQVRVKWEEITL